MGSVARVQKKKDIVGGSARKEFWRNVEANKRVEPCFRIPLLGRLFQFCSERQLGIQCESSHSFGRKSSSFSCGKGKVEESEHDSCLEQDESVDTELCFAMKSIHLDRIADEAFIAELKNEISMLRALDHPHVVSLTVPSVEPIYSETSTAYR